MKRLIRTPARPVELELEDYGDGPTGVATTYGANGWATDTVKWRDAEDGGAPTSLAEFVAAVGELPHGVAHELADELLEDLREEVEGRTSSGFERKVRLFAIALLVTFVCALAGIALAASLVVRAFL